MRLTNISNDKKETLIYLMLWAILFMAPVLSIYIHHAGNGDEQTLPWNELWHIWRQYFVFLAAFLIHNYLLAPLLVYHRRRILYSSGIAALLGVFVFVQCAQRPDFKDHRPDGPRFERFERQAPHGGEPHGDNLHGDKPPMGEPPMDEPPMDEPPGRHHHGPEFKELPPRIVGQHDVVATIIFILMMGMNLGIKFYFRQSHDRKRLAMLEHQNLEQQLEYLKYQINPHFLMNTLNNIHALVDIDPEQAKETIVELSKIMRFVLYEGSKQKVPLRQEIIFLDNYIQLMRMRVAEQVDIRVDIPQVMPDRDIPPLMLITFVENAFKHGVSYRQKSFIDISISVEGMGGSEKDDTLCLCFHCSNSKVPQAEDHHGGVGLQNVKRRLELIYGNTYTLNINDEPNTYTVDLRIPL